MSPVPLIDRVREAIADNVYACRGYGAFWVGGIDDAAEAVVDAIEEFHTGTLFGDWLAPPAGHGSAAGTTTPSSTEPL